MTLFTELRKGRLSRERNVLGSSMAGADTQICSTDCFFYYAPSPVTTKVVHVKV